MRFCLALFLMCIATQAAFAGAWPRERGSGFATVTTQFSWPQDIATWQKQAPSATYRTLYLEFGLTDRTTVGLDLGRSVSGDGKTVGFLQFPLRSQDKGPHVAFQIGAGRISGQPVIRPGLAVGWGLPKGWLSFESLAEVDVNGGDTDYKLDATWGRKMHKGRKLIMQLQTGVPEHDVAFARFAPSLVVPLRKALKAEVGATYGLWGDTSMGLKLGLWTEF